MDKTLAGELHHIWRNIIYYHQSKKVTTCKVCKDQLLLSKAIFEDCKKRRKYLNIACSDYQNTFDSEPHSRIEKSIGL
jgi:hypothetical protein